MKLALDKYGTWLSTIIRLHAYAAATFLMIYMISTMIFSFIDLFQNFEEFVNPADFPDSKNNVIPTALTTDLYAPICAFQLM